MQSNEYRPISCPETSEMCLNQDSSSKKTERILKIIEENSKILDRIMSKNAKSSTPDSGATISDASNRTEELEFPLVCSIKGDDHFDPVHESTVIALAGVETKPDKSVSSDVNDFVTDFLRKFDENNCSEERKLSVDDQVVKDPTKEQSVVLEKCDRWQTQTQRLDEAISESVPQTVEEIIKQAMEKSSPNRSATILDLCIENDLQSLLKMSAELLRDDMTIMSSVLETNIEDDLPEVSASDILSNAFLEFDASEAVTPIKETNENLIVDVIAESTTGDISATISSIKNTIKSIDDLCQEDDRRSRERTDKTLNEIIKVVENLEDDSRQKKHIEDANENVSITIPETAVEHGSRGDALDVVQSVARDEKDVSAVNSRFLMTSRMSRDRSRITSPRHRKYDDFGEFESRIRRSKSPAFAITTETESGSHPIINRYSDDFTKKYSLDAFKLQRIDDGDIAAKSSSLYKSNEKLEIRHTTVTSTFYDRFLSQKLEQQHTMDRSPSSPMINKAYLDTLKPISFMSSSYPTVESKGERRGSKSSENSPVQSGIDASITTANTMPPYLMPHSPYNTIDRTSTYTRSCDNISTNLNKKSGHHSDPSDRTTDYSFKRYSTAGAYSNIASLPIKPKKPSELGVKLGLYEPTS